MEIKHAPDSNNLQSSTDATGNGVNALGGEKWKSCWIKRKNERTEER